MVSVRERNSYINLLEPFPGGPVAISVSHGIRFLLIVQQSIGWLFIRSRLVNVLDVVLSA